MPDEKTLKEGTPTNLSDVPLPELSDEEKQEPRTVGEGVKSKLQDLEAEYDEAKEKVEAVEELASAETEQEISDSLARLKDAEGNDVEVPDGGLLSEAEAEPIQGVSKEVIEEELSALKDALIKAPEEEDEEPVSKVHKMHDKLGMAGSRNAFPIEEDHKRLGQRPGMMIGIPNRHHRKHLKKKGQKAQKPLGKGAFKIDEDRPVNN